MLRALFTPLTFQKEALKVLTNGGNYPDAELTVPKRLVCAFIYTGKLLIE
jgi:hypothetical protein